MSLPVRKGRLILEWSHLKRGALAVAVDPADNKFLECAETASAEYLITGNKRHFPAASKGTRILNAKELLSLIVPDIPR